MEGLIADFFERVYKSTKKDMDFHSWLYANNENFNLFKFEVTKILSIVEIFLVSEKFRKMYKSDDEKIEQLLNYMANLKMGSGE